MNRTFVDDDDNDAVCVRHGDWHYTEEHHRVQRKPQHYRHLQLDRAVLRTTRQQLHYYTSHSGAEGNIILLTVYTRVYWVAAWCSG